MGKVSRQRRSRLRMTLYNASKSSKELLDKDNKIEILLKETDKLKTKNFIIEQKNTDLKNKLHNLGSTTSIDNTGLALLAQKERYTIRHESIVKLLQERYKAKLNSLSEVYQSQIDDLASELKSMSAELAVAKKCLLSSNTRKPVFSLGQYGGIT